MSYKLRECIGSIKNLFIKFKFRNYKILLYTDSRGFDVRGVNDYLHYPQKLAKIFNIEMHICEEKWTTTLDFLKLLKNKNVKNYNLIILHTGIVDHSPRHQTTAIKKIYSNKKEIFNEVFGEKTITEHLHKDFNIEYEGDKTINLYSQDMAIQYLLPILKGIPNLLWISHNKIVPGWNGNYWKERPRNINVIEDYSILFSKNIPNVIDLMSWTYEEVKFYTFDNMHPNKEGSDFIYNEIIKFIFKHETVN